jgi:rhodanese-related sulfurtransferase
VKTISPQEAFELVNAGLAYGIDVREQNEWDAGHSEIFTLHPLSSFDAGKISTDKPVIFICRSGKRSAQACELLQEHGVEATNMTGGMLEWQELQLPMTADGQAPLIS